MNQYLVKTVYGIEKVIAVFSINSNFNEYKSSY